MQAVLQVAVGHVPCVETFPSAGRTAGGCTADPIPHLGTPYHQGGDGGTLRLLPHLLPASHGLRTGCDLDPRDKVGGGVRREEESVSDVDGRLGRGAGLCRQSGWCGQHAIVTAEGRQGQTVPRVGKALHPDPAFRARRHTVHSLVGGGLLGVGGGDGAHFVDCLGVLGSAG